jgi:hypothetical protein
MAVASPLLAWTWESMRGSTGERTSTSMTENVASRKKFVMTFYISPQISINAMSNEKSYDGS